MKTLSEKQWEAFEKKENIKIYKRQLKELGRSAVRGDGGIYQGSGLVLYSDGSYKDEKPWA